jgi:hypothetical protein
MAHVRGKLLACVAGLVVFGFAAATVSADQLLTGSITSGTGQKLEGVQIAASGGPYSGAAARNPCRPARREAGLAPADCPAVSCSRMRDSCRTFRRNVGPPATEGLCVTVFNACMTSGVWDATTVFPWGGARMTGMVRR